MPKHSQDEDNDQVTQDLVHPHKTHVGPKCIARIRGSEVTAHAMSEPGRVQLGHTVWRFNEEEELPSAEIYSEHFSAYKMLLNGKRKSDKNQIPLTNDFGEPVPHVLLLTALQTMREGDWIKAIDTWESVRTDLSDRDGSGVGKGQGFLKDDLDLYLPEPPLVLPFLVASYPYLPTDPKSEYIDELEKWGDQWRFDMGKSRSLDSRRYLDAWESGASRLIKKLAQLREEYNPNEASDGDNGQGDSCHARVLWAIKRAAIVSGGVPYISKVRSLLNDANGPKMSKEQVRTIRKTLGFDWIPEEGDWEKYWSPVAQSQGWV